MSYARELWGDADGDRDGVSRRKLFRARSGMAATGAFPIFVFRLGGIGRETARRVARALRASFASVRVVRPREATDTSRDSAGIEASTHRSMAARETRARAWEPRGPSSFGRVSEKGAKTGQFALLQARAHLGVGDGRGDRVEFRRERVNAHLGHPSLVILDACLALELERAQHLTCVRADRKRVWFWRSERPKKTGLFGTKVMSVDARMMHFREFGAVIRSRGRKAPRDRASLKCIRNKFLY